MRWPSWLAIAAGAVALSGCNNDLLPGPRACTLIGCVNGLTVQFLSPIDGPFTVELRNDYGMPNGATYTYRCDGSSACNRSVFFPDLFPQRALIKVTSAKGERTTEINTVRYETRYPNGEGCPPPCVNGTVVVNTPT